MTKQEILQKCEINELLVKLPDVQLDRKIYLEVAKSLELIGGKWNRKSSGFLFQQDPTDLLAKIAGGEKVNLKKEFQFFATPDALADNLVELAEIKTGHKICEPSAGQGAIIESIIRKHPDADISAIELMDINSAILTQKGFNHELVDFLETPNKPIYDRVVANPPFSKNQDIDHIRHMYDLLKSGGRLVSVASKHWTFSNNKKETKFREWLEEIDAEIQEVESGVFKKSGTNISTCIIIINK